MNDKNLIARFAPVFALHPDEKYNPCSVDNLLNVAEVRVRSSGSNEGLSTNDRVFDQVVIPSGSLMQGNLTEISRRQPNQNIQLNIPQQFWGGTRDEDLNGLPIYATLKRVYEPGSTTIIEAIEINYFFLFAYNGGYQIFCFEVGEHVGDWEHVTMRLDGDGELQAVYYSTHRNYEGDWLPSKEVPTRNNRPLVYLARSGHGCYSRPGTHFRIFGFANDKCSDKGVVWKPREVRYIPFPGEFTRSRGATIYEAPRAPDKFSRQDDIVVNDEDGEWVGYRGFWGTIPNPVVQIWFQNAENPMTWGWLRRVFCQCAPRPPVVFF